MARLEPDREAFETCDTAMRRLNDVIREVCTARAGLLVDLESTFASLHRPDHFYDRNHPNARGCRTIATATLDTLRPHLLPASR
jgi:hypothetical protein